MTESINIKSRDYWFKVVGMLQQNWALIEAISAGCPRVYFFGDTSGVFDELEFASAASAGEALRRNGFARYDEDPEVQRFIARPKPPFTRQQHPSGPIYSSGQHWR
jgi:hypothetical protein